MLISFHRFLRIHFFLFCSSISKFCKKGIVDFWYLLVLAKFTLHLSLFLKFFRETLTGNFFAFSCLMLFLANFRHNLFLLSLSFSRLRTLENTQWFKDDDWWQLMIIDDNWWQLMTIDDNWWQLMTIDFCLTVCV